MSIHRLLKQDVTVQRYAAGSEDAWGNTAASYSTTVDYKGFVEQVVAEEISVGRETRVSDWRLILPPGATLDALDRVVVNGVTFEVVGPPHTVFNPRTGKNAQVEARLRAFED